MVPTDGNAPPFFGNRPNVLLLDDVGVKLVGVAGFEPALT